MDASSLSRLLAGLAAVVAPLITLLTLLSALFLRPSAWRTALQQIDASLPQDFRLVALTPAQWRNPALRRMLWHLLLAAPLLAVLVVAATLSLVHVSYHQLLFSMLTALLNTLLTFCILATLSSLSSGLPGAVFWGITTGIGFGITHGLFDFATTLLFGLGIGMTFCYCVIFDRSLEQYAQPPLSRLLSSSLLGSLVGALAVNAAAILRTVGPLDGASWSRIAVWLLGVWLIAVLPIMLLSGWRRGLLLSVLFSLLTVASNLIGFHVLAAFSDPVLQREMFQIGYNFAFCTLGVLAFALARMLGGVHAGLIAGALGVGGSWMVLMTASTPAHNLPLLLLGLASLLLGMLLGWYGALLLYPLELAWNTLLYQLHRQLYSNDTRYDTRFLRWNAAFWHETQSLPLHGLDSHLVLLASVHPAAAQQMIRELTTGAQRWASQAAQRELDLRLLEGCSDIMAISQMADTIASGQLGDGNSPWIEQLLQLSREIAVAVRYERPNNQRWLLLHVREQLEQLTRTLTVSTGSGSVRSYQIVRHWRILVDQAIAERTAELELHQEIDSPYVVGLPLTAAQDIFIGRHAIAAQIETLLRMPRCPPLLLYGQRRVGKTSLLNNLGQLLPASIVPLFVDLQGCTSHDEGHVRLLYNLARDMRRSAQQRPGLALPALSLETLAAAPFSEFDCWLDAVETTLEQAGMSTMLLMLDEIESLYQALEEGLFNERKVLGMLRHIIQHRPRIKVLLAGSHSLQELQRWSSYLINVQLLKMSYLTKEEARVLIEQPRADFSLRYEPDASQRVIELTRGHPYLVQLLCHAIVTLKNEQDIALRRCACRADVDAAVLPALMAGNLFFADIQRNQLDTAGRSLLMFMAQHGENSSIDRHSLSEIFGQDIHSALHGLLQRDILEQTETGYRFQVELIRRWFAQQPEHLTQRVVAG